MTSEARKAYQKAYYEKNKERIKEEARRRYHADPEKHNANNRRWYQENRERARETQRAWNERNREKVVARNRERSKHLRFSQHGLTEADYLSLLERQNGVCAICQRECDVIDKLSIDHCHVTGLVRGLLCKRCNSGLGFFRDDWRALLTATRYVQLRKVPA